MNFKPFKPGKKLKIQWSIESDVVKDGGGESRRGLVKHKILDAMREASETSKILVFDGPLENKLRKSVNAQFKHEIFAGAHFGVIYSDR